MAEHFVCECAVVDYVCTSWTLQIRATRTRVGRQRESTTRLAAADRDVIFSENNGSERARSHSAERGESRRRLIAIHLLGEKFMYHKTSASGGRPVVIGDRGRNNELAAVCCNAHYVAAG